MRLSHDGQQQTCRKCNQVGHFASACTNIVCFNCDGIGHVSKDCTDHMRCCICKSERHLARSCAYSWHREVRQSPRTNLPSPADTAPAEIEIQSVSDASESTAVAETAEESGAETADADDEDEEGLAISALRKAATEIVPSIEEIASQDLALSDDGNPPEASNPDPPRTQELFTPAPPEKVPPSTSKSAPPAKKPVTKPSSVYKTYLQKTY